MSVDKIFIDSNVLLYLLGNDEKKKALAIGLLSLENYISTQVACENMNVCVKKLNMSTDLSYDHVERLLQNLSVVLIYPSTIQLAYNVQSKYKFSFWDGLIIATAIENNCNILYSEDMQDGQIINNTLKIVNPFKL